MQKKVSVKQAKARLCFKKKIADAKKIYKKGGIKWSSAVKQAFNK